MESPAQLDKLAELRAKTDRQLALLIRKELEGGLRTVRQALATRDKSSAERAEQAYAKAALLLPYVYQIEESERRCLESKLDQLRELLGRLAPFRPAPAADKSTVTAIARALWRARGCPEGSPESDWYRAERLIAGSSKAGHAA